MPYTHKRSYKKNFLAYIESALPKTVNPNETVPVNPPDPAAEWGTASSYHLPPGIFCRRLTAEDSKGRGGLRTMR